VLAKPQSQEWQPAPPAEQRALLRRIYLDLAGLPPTIEEQGRFLLVSAESRFCNPDRPGRCGQT
jgi:hypothetical protein